MFSSTIRLAVTGGIVAALPVITIGIFRLLIPLLPPGERRLAFFFFPAAILSALAGVGFAYYVLLPAGLGFLLSFGTNIATPMIRISEYMSLVTAMMFWLGLVFEMPLSMLMLSKLGVVSHTRFRRLRKFVPPTAVIFAAIITPTFDGLNVMLIAVPLTVMFEIGLFLAWLVRPVERKRLGQLRIALIEAIFMAVLIAGVVAILWYAGVLGGVR